MQLTPPIIEMSRAGVSVNTFSIKRVSIKCSRSETESSSHNDSPSEMHAPSEDQQSRFESTFHTSYDTVHTNLMMVPVRVIADCRIVNTFALIDTGSGITLCNKKMLEMLNMKGDKPR